MNACVKTKHLRGVGCRGDSSVAGRVGLGVGVQRAKGWGSNLTVDDSPALGGGGVSQAGLVARHLLR